MKGKFLKVITAIVAIFMVAVLFTACGSEIIYVYETATRGGSSVEDPSDDNKQPSGGETSDPVVDPVVDKPDDGSTYNLRVWCAEEDEDMIWDMLASYAELHSGNTYNWKVEKQGEDIVSSSVTRDVAAAADVFSFANDQLGTLIQNSALTSIPLTYHSQVENQIEMAKLACTYNNEYYAIPYSYENCFLYYNKSLVSSAQVANMESLLSANIAGVTYNLGIDMNDSYYTTMFLYTAGVNVFGDNGDDPTDIDLNNDAAKKACKYIASLGDKTKLVNIAKTDQYAALKNKNIAAMISGPHMISMFKDALGDNFGVAMLPTIKFAGESEESQLVSFSGIKMYGISQKSVDVRDQKTTDEAIRLASYLANSDNQRIRLEEREFCPTDSELFDSALESDFETVETVYNQAEYSKLKPGIIEMSKYWTPMANFLLGVYKKNKGETTWSDELEKIEAKLRSDN